MTATADPHIAGEAQHFRADPRSAPPLLVFLSLHVLKVLRRLVLAVLIGGLVGIGIALLLPREYTATASFIPDDDSALPAGLGGLVGQFVGLQNQGLSPQLAGALVTETPSLVRTAYERFPVGTARGASDSVRLIDRLERPSVLRRWISPVPDSAHREFAALRDLRSRVAVDIGERTGLVTIVVTLRDPVLAAAVANRLVDRVDEFNARTNQTRARATRIFLEGRTQAADTALRHAQAALEAFYNTNRNFQSSPSLVFQESRLRQQVDIHQQVYLSLVQKLESARIDEVKDTPVLTRVERATPPVKKSFPKLSVFGLIGALLGAVLVLGMAFTRAYAEWYRSEDPAGYERLAHAARQTRATFGRAMPERSRRRSVDDI